MSSGLYTHRTRNAGEIVRDTLYNPAHKNHLTNDVPNQAGALSDTLADFQATQDPAPGGIVNQVISLLEEFQQLRFELTDIKTALQSGVPPTQWYTPISVNATAAVGKGARVFRNTTQSIPLGTAVCSFTTEHYDTGVTSPLVDPFWVIGSPTRLTAKAAGLYQLNGFVQWATGSAGVVAVFIRLNGTTLIAGSEWKGDGTQVPWLSVSTQYLLAQNEYAELVVIQFASNPFNVINPEFRLELLNPSAVVPPPTQFLLTINEIGTGSGTVVSDVGAINCPGVCSNIYADGTMVTLTATPTVGSFVEWTGDVPGSPVATNPITLTMDQARAVTARFTSFTLNITETGSGSGTVVSDVGSINCPGVCDDQYAVNEVVTLTPTSTAGAFIQWSGDVPGGHEFDNPLALTMNADKNIVATFSLIGVLASWTTGINFTGTRYATPSNLMSVGTTVGNAQFESPIDMTITKLTVMLQAALAGGHTFDFQFNINGSDVGTITINMIAGDRTKSGTGSIVIAESDLVCIKCVQSGGGGDTLQALMVQYIPG